jgi:hypothetical protein
MSGMRGAILQLLSAAFGLNITVSNLAANRDLAIRGDWAVGQIPQVDPVDATKLIWISPGSLGGGTVTNFALDTATATVFNVATPSSTPTLSFDNQAINLVFASPASGGAGVPTFRALVPADIPDHSTDKLTSGTLAFARLPVGTAANTVAAGNDSRFHAQGTDTGTTAASFAINSAGTGVRLKDNAGALEVRNLADSAYADLVLRNLIVQGTTTTINTETVAIADNNIVLNSDYAGATPTENGGITLNRGSQTSANLQWNESTDRWEAGLTGAEFDLARQRVFTFNAAALVGGVLTVNHGFSNQYVQFTVWDGGNIGLSPIPTATDANNLSLNFGSATITGTGRVVVTG